MKILFFLLSLFLWINTATCSRKLSSSTTAPSLPGSDTGPIETAGRRFSRVCDPARFALAGLDMEEFPYCDASLSYAERAKDIIGRMTVKEKAMQVGDKAPGVARIGLPKYNWWSEALHGISDVGYATKFTPEVPSATSFPNVILSAASFNESLWKKLGQTVSTEARALYNIGIAGLTFWSPNINVVRDPRWGRILETPGEDPFLVGRYAVNYVRGLQDVDGSEHFDDLDKKPLKVSSCCKHYAAYDVDSWFDGTVDRFHYDARVTEQDMEETFVRPFEMCVKDGDVSSLMCSYNRINGIPTCADPRRLSQTFRKDWNFHGYIVSDCDSIQVMSERTKYINDTPVMAVAQGFKAGMDLNCGWETPISYYQNYTEKAVGQGKVQESDIDNALKNLYVVLFRLGFFDGTPEFESLSAKDVCSQESVELATDAARQGIVLLKNSNNTLPLDPKKITKLGLVGPHANVSKAMIGNYAGPPCRYVTPLNAIQKDVPTAYELGCDVKCDGNVNIDAAVAVAKGSNVTVILAGLDLSQEREDGDRENLFLPGRQQELINKVADAASSPVALVILSGGAVDVSFAEENPKIGAIMWAGYPGEEGGQAIADVLFGRYNPGGRLPLTWYNSDYTDQLPMTSMQLRPNPDLDYPGRTYKFFNGSLQYPFGYGLSYTTFKYNVTSLTKEVNITLGKNQHCKVLPYSDSTTIPACASVPVNDFECTQPVDFEVTVTNDGPYDGSEAVLVYSKAPDGVLDAPIKQLIGFERVFVAAGSHQIVRLSINVSKAFGLVTKSAYSVLPSGLHTIIVGHEGDSFQVQINFI